MADVGVGESISTHSLTKRLTEPVALDNIHNSFNSQPHEEADLLEV